MKSTSTLAATIHQQILDIQWDSDKLWRLDIDLDLLEDQLKTLERNGLEDMDEDDINDLLEYLDLIQKTREVMNHPSRYEDVLAQCQKRYDKVWEQIKSYLAELGVQC